VNVAPPKPYRRQTAQIKMAAYRNSPTVRNAPARMFACMACSWPGFNGTVITPALASRKFSRNHRRQARQNQCLLALHAFR